MKKAYSVLFSITLIFYFNEVLVFGAATKSYEKRRSQSNAYNQAISNIEDPYDTTHFDNADFVNPAKFKLLNFIKEELSKPGGDLESRIEDLENALDKLAGMFCTADEEDLNEKLINLSLAHEGLDRNPEDRHARGYYNRRNNRVLDNRGGNITYDKRRSNKSYENGRGNRAYNNRTGNRVLDDRRGNISYNDSEVSLRNELDQKERKLRQEIIQAIDRQIKTKGVCDNTPSDENILEDY